MVTEGFPLTVEVETPCDTASGAVVVVEPDAEEVTDPVLVGRLMTRDEVGTHSKLFEVDELAEGEDDEASDPDPDADEASGAPVVTGMVPVPVGVEDEMVVPFEEDPPPIIAPAEVEELADELSTFEVAEDPRVEVCSGRGMPVDPPPTPAVGEVPFE